MRDQSARKKCAFARLPGWVCLLLLGDATVAESCVSVPGCTGSAFLIEVPLQRTADVASVTQSGPGCPSSETPYCADSQSPCGIYGTRAASLQTLQQGLCTVTVRFRSGAPPFVATTTFAPQPGCTVGGLPTPNTAYVPATVPAFDAAARDH